MKRSSVLACLVFALAAALPFQPWSDSRPSSASFQVRVDSDESGLMRLYCDSGTGMGERACAVQAVEAGRPAVVRFALPHGTIRALRLELLDRDARMTLAGAQVVDGSGTVLAAFGAGLLRAGNQVESHRERDGGVAVRTEPGAVRPQVAIDLASPLVIPNNSWWVGIAVLFAALVALVAALGRPGLRVSERAWALGRRAAASPGRAILAVAFAATLAANYPIVFAGKSLVSPNLGSALLYGRSPWVPGFQSTEEGNANMADIDALLWHHLPLSMIEHRALFHDGEFPLWNRYDSGGTPLLGQGQSCFGDPLHLIPLLANGAAWAWDLKFLAAKWLFACGIGFCVWRLTRHLPASLLLAASAQFIGFFVYRINHPAIFSLCYSPWILYCWLRIVDAGSLRGSALWMAGLVGANFVEMNSGTVKEAYVLLLWMNLAGACMLLASARTPREKAVLAGFTAVAGTVFVLVASPVWLTFYDALKVAYTTYDAPRAFQIQPGMLAGLFDEAFYRPFQLYSNVINPSANFLILIGVIWCAVRWRSVLANRRAVGLILAAVPALMLVFGVVSPAVITRIPFLGNILHIDNTFSCVLIVLFAVLAGVGWKEAWERLGSDGGRREALAVLAVLALVYASYLGTAQAVVRSAYFAQTWGKIIKVGPFVHGYGLSLVAAAAVLIGVLHVARQRNSLTPALAIYAALALAALHWREGLQMGTAFPDYVIMPASRVDLQARSPTIDAVLAQEASPSRAVGFIDNFFPGWSIVYGLEGICGPDALVNRYYRQLMDASGIERVWDWRYRLQDSQLKSVRPLLDALNVRFYLDYPAGARKGREALSPFRSLDMESYESPSYWPRAFFTDGITVYNDPVELWSQIRRGDGRPFAAIQNSDWARLYPSPRISQDLGERRVEPAADYKLTTNSTSFSVVATGPGIIVLNEAYERGNFEATVNGESVPYLRINNMFKGVYVDAPGTYQVTFTYWPRDFTLALFLAAGGLVLASAALAALFRFTAAPRPEPAHI